MLRFWMNDFIPLLKKEKVKIWDDILIPPPREYEVNIIRVLKSKRDLVPFGSFLQWSLKESMILE